jgi:hypothetical protein
MSSESLEGDIPTDAGPDAAREATGDSGIGVGGDGTGDGVPASPFEPGHEPGHGPTADEATGPTGDPDDEDGDAAA